VLDRASERGYRLGLPAGGAAEQAAVGAIWRQRHGGRRGASLGQALQPADATARQAATAAGGWTADWIFVDGQGAGEWSVSDAPDARRAMASGADGAADALIRSATPSGGSVRPAGTLPGCCFSSACAAPTTTCA
jgi:hypothetical protein